MLYMYMFRQLFCFSFVALLLLGYGWAGLSSTYLASFAFSIPSSAVVWLSMLNIVLGIATVLTVDILSIPQLNLQHISEALESVFLIFIPNFCLGQGLVDLYNNHEFLKLCGEPFVQQLCHANITNPCCLGKPL